MQLGIPEGFGNIGAGREPTVELSHHCQTEGIVDSPQACDDAASARGDERPDEAGDALLPVNASAPSVASGQCDKLRSQPKHQNLACLQHAIVCSSGAQQQRRTRRKFRARQAVRSKVQDLKLLERLPLQF